MAPASSAVAAFRRESHDRERTPHDILDEQAVHRPRLDDEDVVVIDDESASSCTLFYIRGSF